MVAPRKYPWSEVEAQIFSDDRPLDYQEISQKWNIPVDRVRARANRDGWREKKQSVQSLVAKERKKNIHENCLDKVFRADVATLNIAEMLLSEVEGRLTDARIRRERGDDFEMRASDILSLARTTAAAAELNRYHHGDIGIALNTLIECGILPEDLLPQVLMAIEESEVRLAETLKMAFQGRLPD